MYPQSIFCAKIIEKIKIFQRKDLIFAAEINRSILHRHVCVIGDIYCKYHDANRSMRYTAKFIIVHIRQFSDYKLSFFYFIFII